MGKKNGKIVYSPIGKMKVELEKSPNVGRRFDQYRRAGKLKNVAVEDVAREKEGLPELRSDDPDIIALAQAARVRLLISDDENLHADFKTITGGNVYQTKGHKHLLRKDLCP